MDGIVAMACADARVIIDDVFLAVAASQQRGQKALGGLAVLWVGVRCESAVAAGREVARGDRIQGMAASQADVVHEGVFYDLEVDTTQLTFTGLRSQSQPACDEDRYRILSVT